MIDQQRREHDEPAVRKVYPTRWDVTSIPVFVPKQKYDIYSRSWLATTNDNLDGNTTNVVHSALKHDWKSSDSPSIVPLKRTWYCVIMSTIYTFIFYLLCLGTIPIIAFYLYNSFKKTVSTVEGELDDAKNNTGKNDLNMLGNSN